MSYALKVAIASSLSRVWQAWTSPAELAVWLAPKVDVQVRPEGKWEFFWDPDPEVDSTLGCRVLEVVDRKRLRFQWQGKTEYMDMFLPPYGPTEVEVRLRAVDQKVEVEIEQVETRALENWDAYDRWMSEAWEYALAELKKLCEGG